MSTHAELTAPDLRIVASWRPTAVVAVAAAVGLLLGCYWQTAASMASLWLTSATFSHGLVVVPIVLWLVWRQRELVGKLEARPWYPGLAALAVAGFGWLVGQLANVASLAHFSLVFSLQIAVLTIVGLQVGRALSFPLGFLLFAVPTGEFLIPYLTDWTAAVTVGALRATGIPVFQEGNRFVIPSGEWSVIEACSGIRYMTASLMVGTLYAYLFFRSTRRRAVFVLASLFVPVLANWMRTYLIVLLGHLSNNTIAVGIDHLIYGWIFFGVIIGLLFGLGARWREDGAPIGTQPSARVTAPQDLRRGRLYATAAAVVLVAGLWPTLAATLRGPAVTRTVQLAEIEPAAAWRKSHQPLTTWTPQFVGAHGELRETFAAGDEQVGIHIAYYRGQAQGRELVNRHNVLVREDDGEWQEAERGEVPFAWAGQPSSTAAASTLIGRNERLLVRWFYWLDGWRTTSEYAAKARLALYALAGRNDGSAIVVVYTRQAERQQDALSRLERFGAEVGPAVERVLAQARRGGS